LIGRSYKQKAKVVSLDDIATELSWTTGQVIEKIKDLEARNEINGILDGNGKYIHVTMQEMQALAEFIIQKGRLNRSDFESKCQQVLIESSPQIHPPAQQQKVQ
jgi:CTP-dependent riboflavin kinase